MWHKVREKRFLNAATSRDKGEMKRREKKVLGASAKEEDGMHRWSLLSFCLSKVWNRLTRSQWRSRSTPLPFS